MPDPTPPIPTLPTTVSSPPGAMPIDYKHMALHVLCVIAILACFWLVGQPFVQALPMHDKISEALIGSACLLYGKYLFLPNKALIYRFIQSLGLEEVVRIQTMAPPPPAGTGAIPPQPPAAPPTPPTPPSPPSAASG